MVSRKQIVVLSLCTLPLLSRVLAPSASNDRTRHNRLFVFRKRRGYGYGRLCVTFPTAIARRVNTTYDARCLKFAEGMAAPRWSPAPRRGRKLVARGGAARRGEAKRTWWDETKRDQAKRGEERRREAKSGEARRSPCGHICTRGVCAPTASTLFCVDTSTCVCVAFSRAGVRVRCSSANERDRVGARAQKGSMAPWRSYPTTTPSEPHRAKRYYTIKGDTGVVHAHTFSFAHVHVRSRRKRDREKERSRERERESTSGTNQQRESKRVRTMYARYGPMTYYEQVDGRARGGTRTAGT